MRIGFYNVENLLPADGSAKDPNFAAGGCLRWGSAAAAQKIANLAAVIRAAGPPRILGICEVGSAEMLHALADAVDPRGEFYRHRIFAAGQDPRGIGLGVLSQLPWTGDPILHDIHDTDGLWDKATRGILQLRFSEPTDFTLLVNHWPAPRPTAQRLQQRRRAAQVLGRVVNDAGGVVLAVGDFNMEPWHDILDREFALTTGRPSRTTGRRQAVVCVPQAVHDLYGEAALEHLPALVQRGAGLLWGTIRDHSEDRWVPFDHVLLFAPLGGAWPVRAPTLSLANVPVALNASGYPRSYDRLEPRLKRDSKGASDHLMVYVDLPAAGSEWPG